MFQYLTPTPTLTRDLSTAVLLSSSVSIQGRSSSVSISIQTYISSGFVIDHTTLSILPQKKALNYSYVYSTIFLGNVPRIF